jgi:hypothetical protein
LSTLPLQKFPAETVSACAQQVVAHMAAAMAGEPCSQGMQRHVIMATQKLALAQAPDVMRACTLVWMPYVTLFHYTITLLVLSLAALD